VTAITSPTSQLAKAAAFRRPIWAEKLLRAKRFAP
jgi:hypothetical protein